MFRFIKKMFIVVTGFIGLSKVSPLKCASMNNQEFNNLRPEILNINNNEPSF